MESLEIIPSGRDGGTGGRTGRGGSASDPASSPPDHRGFAYVELRVEDESKLVSPVEPSAEMYIHMFIISAFVWGEKSASRACWRESG